MKPLISLIIPVYNEEKNIPHLYTVLINVLKKVPSYEFEIIFVNDGSTDSSGELLDALSDQNNSVKYIEFSRNFGKEIATTAGIVNAKGEAAILLDADLQHPPELIPEFITRWESGADMVIGVRKRHNGETLFKRIGSIVFYNIVNVIGETKITPHATDFRLINRKVMNAFNFFTEKNRITRGLLDWLGFHRDYIYFQTDSRHRGSAGYSYRKLTTLALYTFIAHSLFPLKVAGYLGGIITILSGLTGLFILVEKYILGDPLGMNFSGPAVLAIINLFLVGIVLSCIGVISLYIGNIHEEVLARPIYVIRTRKNFDDRI